MLVLLSKVAHLSVGLSFSTAFMVAALDTINSDSTISTASFLLFDSLSASLSRSTVGMDRISLAEATDLLIGVDSSLSVLTARPGSNPVNASVWVIFVES